MAKCDVCGTGILFGGVKSDGWRFCSQKCAGNPAWQAAMRLVPQDELDREIRTVHQGNCPHCNGPGPVDVHTSHTVLSALVFTRWSSPSIVACRSCGKKQQLKHLASSMLLGWWGFPFGLILTPVQVARNLGGLAGMSGPSPETPSADLSRVVRLAIASRRQAVG